jgi:hypothetical protein
MNEKPIVIDSFVFSGAGNEMKILEIRLNELKDVVDYFTKLIPSYLDGDFSTQQPNYSQPATAKASGGQSKPSNK